MAKQNEFGSIGIKGGAKIISQEEWNDLNTSLTNINIGDNDFLQPKTTNDGINIPYDSFFFPHVAEIYDDYEQIIVGSERSEDFYPYIDTLSMTSYNSRLTYKKFGSKYRLIDVDKYAVTRPVGFTSATFIEPVKPVDNNNGVIVGYAWNLIPDSSDASGNEDQFSVVITWEPGIIYEEDPQKGTYSEEWSTDTLSASVTSFIGGDVNTPIQTLVNEAIAESVTLSSIGPVTLEENANYTSYIVTVPVARCDWNGNQTSLVRVVQLLFGSGAGNSEQTGSAGGGALPPVSASVIYNDEGAIQLSGDIVYAPSYHYYGSSTVAGVKGWWPLSAFISVSASIAKDANNVITFVNDEVAPGNSEYYGTNISGTKGWYPLPSTSGTTLSTRYSIETIGGTTIQFKNDEDTPGNNEFYGTNSAGTKGWYSLSEGLSSHTESVSGTVGNEQFVKLDLDYDGSGTDIYTIDTRDYRNKWIYWSCNFNAINTEPTDGVYVQSYGVAFIPSTISVDHVINSDDPPLPDSPIFYIDNSNGQLKVKYEDDFRAWFTWRYLDIPPLIEVP